MNEMKIVRGRDYNLYITVYIDTVEEIYIYIYIEDAIYTYTSI